MHGRQYKFLLSILSRKGTSLKKYNKIILSLAIVTGDWFSMPLFVKEKNFAQVLYGTLSHYRFHIFYHFYCKQIIQITFDLIKAFYFLFKNSKRMERSFYGTCISRAIL